MGNISVYLGESLIQELDKMAEENRFKNRSSLVKSALEDKVHFLRSRVVECMECQKPIKDPGMGMVSWIVDEGNRLLAFSVHHKGSCDDRREKRLGTAESLTFWLELKEVSSPKGFISFLLTRLHDWDGGCRLEDFEGLVKVIERLSRSVLRRSTRKELEQWEHSGMFAPLKGSSRGKPGSRGMGTGKTPRKNPFQDVVGVGGDGTLSQNIDEALYGDSK